jgi:Tfp pilus assembly protein PilO
MSYALRNTLILLTTLILMGLGGYAYIAWTMDEQIEELEKVIASKETELTQLSSKANDYLIIQERHTTIKYQAENATKELLRDNNVATIFDYLREINSGPSFTGMNFSLRDSVLNADHGIVRVAVDGSGEYGNFYNFLLILEQSKPIARITDIRIAPLNETPALSDIQFQMNVQFYYARGATKSNPDMLVNSRIPARLFNPMYPLVHEVPTNDLNLPNVDQSRLVGLTGSGAYIIDQNGEFMFVPVGNRVYLGRLQSVDPSRNTATFTLNRGGIADTVVLRISP